MKSNKNLNQKEYVKMRVANDIFQLVNNFGEYKDIQDKCEDYEYLPLFVPDDAKESKQFYNIVTGEMEEAKFQGSWWYDDIDDDTIDQMKEDAEWCNKEEFIKLYKLKRLSA